MAAVACVCDVDIHTYNALTETTTTTTTTTLPGRLALLSRAGELSSQSGPDPCGGLAGEAGS